MTKLSVTDSDRGLTRNYGTADAAAYEEAFEDFASDEDRRQLAKILDEGCLYESWSGKCTSVVERDREPLRYWTILCSMIETDNQIWIVE